MGGKSVKEMGTKRQSETETENTRKKEKKSEVEECLIGDK